MVATAVLVNPDIDGFIGIIHCAQHLEQRGEGLPEDGALRSPVVEPGVETRRADDGASNQAPFEPVLQGFPAKALRGPPAANGVRPYRQTPFADVPVFEIK